MFPYDAGAVNRSVLVKFGHYPFSHNYSDAWCGNYYKLFLYTENLVQKQEESEKAMLWASCSYFMILLVTGNFK